MVDSNNTKENGKWIWWFNDYGWADSICSNCGWKHNHDVHCYLDYKYCPECGTKMDGYAKTSEGEDLLRGLIKRGLVKNYEDPLNRIEV
jgi:hypothetical protein